MEGTDIDPMVVVMEPATIGLASHLSQRGSPVSPNDVRARIHRGLARDWGTSKAKRFDDQAGGGWFIDLSDFFNDEMLYAIVRSGPAGTRAVVAVVEADDIEAAQKGSKKLPAIDGDFQDEEAANAIAQAPARAPARPVSKPAQAQENPGAPVLILVIAPDFPEPENFIRTTMGESRARVAELLQGGTKPEHIEIWTGVRKPKVQIAFE